MGMKQNFNAAKEEVKKQIKQKIKMIVIQILIKITPIIFGFILIGGFFFVIQEKLKDTADTVVSAASKVTSIFDNKSDTPVVVINDDIIKDMKKQMEEDGMDIDDTYVTDTLLKASLEAYYATQYPYIDGVDYGDTTSNESTSNVIKGCIYLKRGNDDMSYINYDDFKDKLGSSKSTSDKDKVKNSFSVDDDGNIVVATWNMTNTVTETIKEDGTYDQDGSETSTAYDITEYKIDQKTVTEQYAMSYKLPILLADMYSNEGFGIAVANLGKNAKIVLTVLDSTSETSTTTKEYMNINYKTSGTYSWRDMEDDPLKTEKFEDITWVENHTDEDKVYKITTESSETNQITVKPTEVDTWSVKGKVSKINKNETTSNNANSVDMENDADYKEDSSQTVSNETIESIKSTIINNREEGSGPMTENSIESVDAKIYKKVTDHKKNTETTTKETNYTASDMELKDNTDKFLALIRADKDGNFDKDGELVKYLKKGAKVTETKSAVNWTSNSSSSTSDGDYIVDITKSDSNLVIKDKKTLIKAFKGYTTNKKLIANVDTFLEMQDKYKVNAVFAAAVSIKETTAGTKGHAICCKNWFNYQPIKDMVKGDSSWASFSDEKDSIMGFGQLIATSPDYYFSQGKYSVYEIGPDYCEGDAWPKEVSGFMDELYKAAGIDVKDEGSETGSSTSAESDGYTKTYTANGKTYKEFKQGQGTYKEIKYSDGNISSSGCGPTSAAIVASGYGKDYNPGTLVEAAKKKYHASSFTASPEATGKMLKTAGLDYTETFSLSKEQLKKHLQSGKPVVMSVDNSCGGLFTDHTHYIAILDINKKGNKVYVANPSSKASGWIDIDKVIKCNSSSSRVAFLITTSK